MPSTLLRSRRRPGYWLLPFFLLLLLTGRSQAQRWDQALPVGRAPLGGSTTINKTVTDAAGNVYVTGSFYGTVDFGGIVLSTQANNAIFVAKLTSTGTYQWVTQATATFANGLGVDASGNVYVSGAFHAPGAAFGSIRLTNTILYDADVYVAKLNTNGQWQWAVPVQSPNFDSPNGLAVDAGGTVYVVGLSGGVAPATFGSLTLSGGGPYVAQLSSGGQWQWVRPGGYTHTDVATDAAGNAYVAGSFPGTSLSFGSIVLTSQYQDDKTYVAKLSSAGQWQWAAASTLSANGTRTSATSLAVDAAGGVYVAGRLTGIYGASFGSTALQPPRDGSYAFVAKLNPGGQWQWAQQTTGNAGAPLNGGSYVEAADLTADAAGNVYLCGMVQGSGQTFGTTVLTGTSFSGQDPIDLFVACLNAGGQWAWAVRTGSTGYETAASLCVGNGALYVAGKLAQTVTFGPSVLTSGPADAYVAQMSLTGQWQWARSTSTGGQQRVTSVAHDAAGNAYVAGWFDGRLSFGTTTLTSDAPDAFVGKVSPSGQWLWVARAGGSSPDQIDALALDAAGNVYVAGNFASRDARFGATQLSSSGGRYQGTDVFVAKLDPTGQWQWAVAAGGSGDDACHGLAVDAAGNVSITGEFVSPRATFGATALTNTATFAAELFVARLSAAGQWQWAVQGSGSGDERSSGITVDASGNSYLTGYTQSPTLALGSTTLTNAGYSSGYVAKLNSAGQWQWATLKELLYSSRVKLDAAGNVYVAGGYYGTPTIGAVTLPRGDSSNVFVAKLSPAGQWQWGLGAGATGAEYLGDLAVDVAGNAFLAGYYASNRASFDSTILHHTGGTYAFLARADATGQWSWALPVAGYGATAVDLNGPQLYLSGDFAAATASFGSQVVTNDANGFTSAYLARLTDLTLGTAAASARLLGGSAYPSPTAGPLTVQLRPLLSGPVTLTVRDALGRTRLQRTLPASLGQLQQYQLPEAAHWAAGVYTLTLRQGQQQQVLKVVHQ